jgi:hypothetical protein
LAAKKRFKRFAYTHLLTEDSIYRGIYGYLLST